MDAEEVQVLARATLEGSLPFPEIVGRLIADGVEYYHVDYAARCFNFYDESGGMVSAPLAVDTGSAIAADFDAPALKAAIVDSQQHGQSFRDFCARATAAGVMGYFAFLRGRRVVYLGRQGDQHTEWFPSAKPGGT